eukprot:01025.XXX_2522_301_1 [CDS] Oithona nana genome sequencing.
MGCARSKYKSSHCYNCGSRKYPSLSHITTTKTKSKKTLIHIQHNIEEIQPSSQNIFSQAQFKMSNLEETTSCKRLKMDEDADLGKQGSNVFVTEHKVSRAERGKVLDFAGKFRGCVVWFTGLSGAGKSTIAMGVENQLVSRGIQCYCLDGDNMRAGLNKGLGFQREDRQENIRRTAEVAKIVADSGQIVLCSLISPNEADRSMARMVMKAAKLPFFEVYVNTPVEECERRDTKGLYEKQRNTPFGLIGVDKNQPYEAPVKPELDLNTVGRSVEETVNTVIKLLRDHDVIPINLPAKSSPLKSIKNGVDEIIIQELFVADNRKDELREKALKILPKIEISEVDLQWVQVLSEGWAAPLKGFMREDQYLQSLHFNCLTMSTDEKTNQSVPIVLAINDDQKALLENQTSVALFYNQSLIAVLEDLEIYAHRKEERVCRQFGTNHPDHPYIQKINQSGDWLLGGDLQVFERIKWGDGLDDYRLKPNELRAEFRKKGADVVYAFQLRNPVHNGHALLMKDCERQLREEQKYKKPVLLLHPLGGWTKDDDVPLHIRIKQHKAILDDNEEEGILKKESTVLAIFPSPMMYAGPTEVQWHAKARQVAGADFYIVGRDPAGLPHPNASGEDLYHFSHGGQVLAMAPGLTHLKILKFKVAAYDKKKQKMDYFDPKKSADFEFISGTMMRKLAKNNQEPPPGFMVTKAWKILAEFYNQNQRHHGNGAAHV